jgi:hypothetical protein
MVSNYCSQFSAGLLNPQYPVPDDVTTHNGKAVMSRYNVYRNNVTVSLINAIASIFPVTQRLTGPDFFRAMARSYVRSTPPESHLLWEYGGSFPEFIDGYEYAAPVPWLSDVARIERAWLNAWHAADYPVLSYEDLSRIPSEKLMTLRFVPHPASQVLCSAWPAMSIYAKNRDMLSLEAFTSSDAEQVLITRPDTEVIVTLLPEGGALFLERLLSGAPLDESVEATLIEVPDFDLSINLAGMISAGVFSAVLENNINDE